MKCIKSIYSFRGFNVDSLSAEYLTTISHKLQLFCSGLRRISVKTGRLIRIKARRLPASTAVMVSRDQ